MFPGSTQHLKMRTRILKPPVRKAENLTPASADVTESGSLNLPEPSEPHRPVMGMHLYIYIYIYIYMCVCVFHFGFSLKMDFITETCR
jgi:hypothetical protein